VILDSAALPDARAALTRMAGKSVHGVLLGDFSWTRLTRWRAILSQVFENRQNLAELQRIAKVTVVATGEPSVAAWYMGAWVMDALAGAGAHPDFHMERTGESQPGELKSIVLSGAAFSAGLERCGARLIVTVGGLAYCNHLPALTEYSLLEEELRIVGHDAVFEATLVSAQRLSGGGL
jgi:hypothetical protein